MKCPYTTAKFLIGRLGKKSCPVSEVYDDLQHEDPIKTFQELNRFLTNNLEVTTGDSASNIRGNNPINVYPGAKGVTMTRVLSAELHKVLRVTIGEVGKKLDISSLPAEVMENLNALKYNIKKYQLSVKPLKQYHDKICKDKIYNDLNTLISNLGNHKNDDEIADKIKITRQLDEKAADCLGHLSIEVGNISSFRFVNDTETIENKGSKEIQNPAQWLICAPLATLGILDTTKIPEDVGYYAKLTVGLDHNIVPSLLKQLRAQPQMQRPAVMNVLQHGIMKLQNAVTGCGAYEEISRQKPAKELLSILKMSSPAEFEQIIQRKKTGNEVEEMPPQLLQQGAKCPLGYGPQ